MARTSAKLIWFRLADRAIGRRAEESDLGVPYGGHEPWSFHERGHA